MGETTRPSQNWLQRVLSRFRPHRGITDGTEEVTIIGPISPRAVASVERALRWISKVPGGDSAQLRLGVAMDMIKGLSVVSAPDATIHDTKTLRWLEYNVRYLAELLEPFAQIHRSQISPLLQSEVLILSRELETASSKIKPAAPSKEAPRWYSFYRTRREEHRRNASEVRAFTLDFKFALDQFRGNALPLYPITPIEAALLPLGVISNSSCTLLPFMEWILKSERVMEYRIGVVRSIRLYSRSALEFSRPWEYQFVLVALENRRRIENWLKIELNDSDARGSIVFGNTREALDEGIIGSYPFSLRPEEDTLPVTLFAREVQGFCAWYSREPYALSILVRDLRARYNGDLEP